ncbi:MAG: hypothetical protein NTV34_15910 [Proteobacteria bacterium]|nr:hypothetical protein [Pseudomonadota bacterium]
MKLTRKLGLAMIGIMASASAYSQQSVEWNVNGSVLAGSGCQKDIDYCLYSTWIGSTRK